MNKSLYSKLSQSRWNKMILLLQNEPIHSFISFFLQKISWCNNYRRFPNLFSFIYTRKKQIYKPPIQKWPHFHKKRTIGIAPWWKGSYRTIISYFFLSTAMFVDCNIFSEAKYTLSTDQKYDNFHKSLKTPKC